MNVNAHDKRCRDRIEGLGVHGEVRICNEAEHELTILREVV